MKESSEDTMLKNIKEVLEQYEPDYSPQFWENLSKQRPVPESRLTTLLLKYKLWLSVLTIAGVLFIIYRVTDLPPTNKNVAADPLYSESANNFLSEKSKEIAYSEKAASIRHSTLNIGIIREGKNISPKVTQVGTTDYLPVTYQNYTQTVNAITGVPGRIEQNPVFTNMLAGIDVRLSTQYFTDGPHKISSRRDSCFEISLFCKDKEVKITMAGIRFYTNRRGQLR